MLGLQRLAVDCHDFGAIYRLLWGSRLDHPTSKPPSYSIISSPSVVFLGKDSSELVMVPQTTYLRLHGW